jgi:hypothetical protein
MQRMLATACAVVLASLAPAIELDDVTAVDATETAARHHGSAPQTKTAPTLRLASLTEGDLALQDVTLQDVNSQDLTLQDDGTDARPGTLRDEELPPDAGPRDLSGSGLPSLDALDAAFDVPRFPALDALDIAFDNGPVEPPPVPLPMRRPPTYAEMCEALASAATEHSLPAPFLIRLIWQESRFRHNVISHAGAQGIAQFMPETANVMGLDDPFDPLEALPVSARFLRKLIERFGNLGLAAAAYNAGPKRVLDWLAGKGTLPKETQDYVKTITGQPAETWRNPEASVALQRVPPRAPCQREAGLFAANGPERIPLPPDSPTVNPEKTLLAAAEIPAAARRPVVADAAASTSAKKREPAAIRALAAKALARAAGVKAAGGKAPKAGTSASGAATSGSATAKKSGRSAHAPAKSAKTIAVAATR